MWNNKEVVLRPLTPSQIVNDNMQKIEAQVEGERGRDPKSVISQKVSESHKPKPSGKRKTEGEHKTNLMRRHPKAHERFKQRFYCISQTQSAFCSYSDGWYYANYECSAGAWSGFWWRKNSRAPMIIITSKTKLSFIFHSSKRYLLRPSPPW